MKRPVIKDKQVLAYVQLLESDLEKFTKSSYVDSYLSLKKIVDKGNKQIQGTEFDILDDDQDNFKKVSKFLSLQKEYLEQMEYFRSKMKPEDRKDLEARLNTEAGIAERIALSEKK